MKMLTTRYVSMALSVLDAGIGALDRTVLKMLTRTRKSVTRSAILPGMTSGLMRKDTQETLTKRMHGR